MNFVMQEAVHVIALDRRTLHVAGRVAAALGSSVGSSLERPIRGDAPRGRLVVALPNSLTDEVLSQIIADVSDDLSSACPWTDLQVTTLLVARDLAALERFAERSVAWLSEDGRKGPRLAPRIVHIAVDEHAATLRAFEIGAHPASDGPHDLDPTALHSSLEAPSAALAYRTHGVESCAQGGHDVVLCGRTSTALAPRWDAPGMLACGRGHPCPRGPRPAPLDRLKTEALLLASCNGLRLGSATLDRHFNLGLNFLDGDGYAYVSNVTASYGNEAASLVWSAAQTDGTTVAQATQLMNAFLHFTGLDTPSYVAVGLPDYRAVTERSPLAPIETILNGKSPTTVDVSGAHMAELVVSGAEAEELATGAATLDARADSSGPIYWFARPELARDGGATTHVWLFRFPEMIGRVAIAAMPVAEAASVQASIDALRRWIEIIRLVQPAERRNMVDEAAEVVRALDDAAATESVAQRFDASAPARLASLGEQAVKLLAALRDEVIDVTADRLEGPFWLPNQLGAQHVLVESHASVCPHCRGVAQRKRVRHRALRHERVVTVCFRCLIAADVSERGEIEGLAIEVPPLAAAGEDLTVVLRLRLNAPPRTFRPCGGPHHHSAEPPSVFRARRAQVRNSGS